MSTRRPDSIDLLLGLPGLVALAAGGLGGGVMGGLLAGLMTLTLVSAFVLARSLHGLARRADD
jgi:fructose-specific phosphotransferase system IIC component